MSKDKESICVTVRVRPLSGKELDEDSRLCLKVDELQNMISMNALNGEKEAKDFYFDSVCDRISQNQMFERVGRRSTGYCMEGYNCTIFAYGQTGAGKTFTMMGVNPESRDFHDLRGLIPRTLEHLFDSIETQISEAGVDYMIKCSFVEIYNEQIIDLLGCNNTLSIREDLKKGVYIEGVTEETISKSEDALEILRKGSKGRHVGSTCYNETSSRSHSVFTMQIDSQKLNNGIKSTKSRHFHFIDLAGSERTKKSIGDRLKEGCSINKSLHVLSTVIGSLAEVSEGKTRHINYRDSKLTFLLKDSLGGNSKTHVIANVSPSWVSSHETRSTLIFARKVKMIKMSKVSINEDSFGNLESLKSEIKRLKSEIILLRNGASPLDSSVNSNPQGSNFKMIGVLQQYVDEELDKQTQMQLELTKISTKNSYLQKGIKHFSENEKQLRLVIAIYEDKLKKQKEIESKLLQDLDSSEKAETFKDYLQHERSSLLQQIERLKKIGSSTGLVKTLLRDLRMIREEPQQDGENSAMIEMLNKNNQFLKEIRESIKELEPEVQDGKATASVLKESEEIKAKNESMSEEIQKQNIEISEIKDKLEETEALLEEAITTQIALEKKIDLFDAEKEELRSSLQESIRDLTHQLSSAKEDCRSLQSINNELETTISDNKIQITSMKKDLAMLKEKHSFEEKNHQEAIEGFEQERVRLEQVIKEKTDEISKLRSEAIDFKNEMMIVSDALNEDLQEYQRRVKDSEEAASKLELQKTEMKAKLEGLKAKWEAETKERQNTIIQLSKQKEQGLQQIKTLQEQLSRQTKVSASWNDKYAAQSKQFEVQKLKWDEHNRQLLSMINEKEVSDSETHQKLTSVQLELINAHDKCSHLEAQILKLQGTIDSNNQKSEQEIAHLSATLREKEGLEKNNLAELSELRRKLKQVEDSLDSEKKKIELLAEELGEKTDQEKKSNEEILRLKEKEKELRISINEHKSQIYASKKSHEVEVESLKETVKRREDELSTMERQHHKVKDSLERALLETQRLMESEIEVMKENEVSIKRALESHLKNKEVKITELKQAVSGLEEQLSKKQDILSGLSVELAESQSKLESLLSQHSTTRLQLQEKSERLDKMEQTFNETESEHIKVVEEMENNFNEELDAKNAEIQKLQMLVASRECEIEHLRNVSCENSCIKTELDESSKAILELRQILKNLEAQCVEAKRLYQNSQHQCGHLEGKLNERDNQIGRLERILEDRQQLVHQQEKQIQDLVGEEQKAYQAIQQDKRAINQLEQQMMLKSQTIQDLNQQIVELSAIIEDLTTKIAASEQHIQNLTGDRQMLQQENIDLKRQLMEVSTREQIVVSEMNQMASVLSVQGCEKVDDKKASPFERFKNHMESLNREIDHWKQETTSLRQEKVSSSQTLETLQKMIEVKENTTKSVCEKYDQIAKVNSDLHSQVSELRTSYDQICNQKRELQAQVQSLQASLQNSQEQIKNCEAELELMEKAKSQEVLRLNQLYEKLRQEKENLIKRAKTDQDKMQGLRLSLEDKVEQLQKSLDHQIEVVHRNQTHLVVERERNEELQRYIEEQNTRSCQLARERDELFRENEQKKLRLQSVVTEEQNKRRALESQRSQIEKKLMIVSEESRALKAKVSQMEDNIKMSNERGQKYRKEFYRERDSNREFKQLLDNAHCQIESFKAEAQDKDRLYHQLLEKVSRNDVERKGLLTQDRKISELLQKSRVEVNEYRKKYDDQLKINNLLKQEIEKKEVENAIVKEHSEEFLKKQQGILESIREDHCTLEADYKKMESQYGEAKKSLQNSSLKISELEDRYQQVLNECRNAQRLNEEIKKESLKCGSDDRQLIFINKLKEENKLMMRQLEKMEQESNKDKSELIRLKSEKRYGRDPGEVSTSDYNKKLMEIKYLQKQFDDLAMVFGNLELTNKKSVGEGIRAGITELQRELARTKSQNMELKEQLHSKIQKLNIMETQKHRGGLREDDGTLNKLRTKISKTSSTFEGMRHSKEEDKSILHMKDPNKSSAWSFNR